MSYSEDRFCLNSVDPDVVPHYVSVCVAYARKMDSMFSLYYMGNLPSSL